MKSRYTVILHSILILNISCNKERKTTNVNVLEVRQISPHRIEKTSLYDDGNIKYKLQFFNGIIDGISEEYYPNGRIKFRTFWKKGKQSFIYEKYADDGTPLNENRTVRIDKIGSFKTKQFNRQVRIFLSDTTQNVVMFICDYKDNFIEGKSIIIPVENGIGTIAFVPLKKEAKIKGVIRIIRDKNIFEKSYPFEFLP
ncbi:MAG: hypothetical protein V4585_07085 [Bacteroidota bacterium]